VLAGKEEYKEMFKKYMKGSTYGYIIGLVIGVPLFAFTINQIFFKGNRATDIEVKQYLANSKIETFEVKKWINNGYEQYTVAWQRGSNNSAFIEWFTFYDNSSKKYINLTVFDYLEKNKQGSQRISDIQYFKDNIIFMAYVNQNQLKNPKYGTKENPLPIWPKDLIEYDGKRATGVEGNRISNRINTFYVKPETNYIFIQQYLSRFMDKEEYKEMFKK